MLLTKSQAEQIKSLYGEDTESAQRTLEQLCSKKGVLRIFNEDGTLKITKEELEKKLNKPTKKKKSLHDLDFQRDNQEFIHSMNQVITYIKNLKSLEYYDRIKDGLLVARVELQKKKQSLKQKEIERINEEIKSLQNKILELQNEKSAE